MGKRVPITSLKLFRIQSGLRQYEVAQMLGIPQPAYCHREAGRIKVTATEAIKLAKILDTPVEDLFPDGKS